MTTTSSPASRTYACGDNRAVTVKLSRSAFYYSPVGIDAEMLELMKQIDRVFTKYPFFGGRQITAWLRREGFVVGRHRVAKADGDDGAGGDLQASQNQPAASATPGLTLFAEEDGDRPPQSGQVG